MREREREKKTVKRLVSPFFGRASLIKIFRRNFPGVFGFWEEGEEGSFSTKAATIHDKPW